MFFKAVTVFINLPLGFFHDKVGVGAPSPAHINFTVCPIQDWDVAGMTVFIVGASVKYNDASDIETNKETNMAEVEDIIYSLIQILRAVQVHIVRFHSRCDCSLTIFRGIWKVVCASSRVLWVLIFNAFILRSKEAEL